MGKSRGKKRGAGILLPISSLPSPYGIGTLGKDAYRFVNWLSEAGQRYWQVLPVGPTSFGDSPYQSFSAFAGNPYFIDLDLLSEEGLLNAQTLKNINWGKKEDDLDYAAIFKNRFKVLHEAFRKSEHKNTKEYHSFCKNNAFWLEDYSLYMALKFYFQNKEWSLWEEDIRLRKQQALSKYKVLLREEIEFWTFCQFKFMEQWKRLKAYANKRKIKIIGDIPLYVSMDSADVWVNGCLFELDEKKRPIHVAGVPPDYFSEDGQLWGNPLYRWDVMEQDDFRWWRKRMESCAKLYDVIRIDHFIGIVRYFAIPADAKSAKKGKYHKGPGLKLTNIIKKSVGDSEIIAEDLGVMIPEVRELIQSTGWPGMKILLFAFEGSAENEYLPHNYTTGNCIVYGGTHDNDTLVGFFEGMKKKNLKFVYEYLNINNKKEIPMAMLRLAYSSIADTAIFQMQDILGLDNKARMNLPSTVGINWRWRLKKGQLLKRDANKLKKLVVLFDR